MTMEFIALEEVHDDGFGFARFPLRVRGSGIALSIGSGEGFARLSHVAFGLMEGGTDIGEPEVPAFGIAQLFSRAQGLVADEAVGNGEAASLMDSRGGEGAEGRASMRMHASGYEAPGLHAYGYLQRRSPLIYGYGDQWFQTMLEPVLLSSSVSELPVSVIRDVVAVQASCRAGYVGTHRLRDTAAFSARVSWVVRLLLQEGVAFGAESTADFLQIVRVVSRVLASGSALSYAEAVIQVADALVFMAITGGMTKADLTDTVRLGSTVDAVYALVVSLLERILMQGSATGTQTMVAVVSERVLFNATSNGVVDLAMVLRESIGFAATLSFDDGQYIAWVLNTESKGLSTYTNYPFNSFACIGGRYVGAASDGLHWLEGDTDNGDDIHAFLRTGLSSIGTRLKKRLPEAFVGYASDGTLILKVIAVGEGGRKEAALYRLPMRPASDLTPNRFKIGRGMESVDWAFEIHNVDGSDFDLASIEFRPVFMSRRTRG